MNYIITFVFKDEKKSTMTLPKEEVPKMFDCLTRGVVYEQPETKRGYWINIQDIRWIILDLDQEEQNNKVEKIEDNNESLPEGK